jgi:hypothetical protein
MHSDFITFPQLEKLHVAMSAKHNHYSFGVRTGDNYLPLQMLTIGASHASHGAPN